MSRCKSNEEIVNEIRNGIDIDENKMLLYEKNKGLIFLYMKKFIKTGDDPEEWHREAYFAIEKAVDVYKPEKGSFTTLFGHQLMSTFCTYRRICRGIPAKVIAHLEKYDKEKIILEVEKGRAVTPNEVAENLGFSREQLENILQAKKYTNIHSLDSPTLEDDDNSFTLESTIQDSFNLEETVINKIIQQETKEELQKILESELNQRERELIKLIYYENYSVSDVGRKWGVSSSRASYIHNTALKKLRNYYNQYL